MNNVVKEHIDRLLKKRLKKAVDNEFNRCKPSVEVVDEKSEKKLRNEIRTKLKEKLLQEYEYGHWLNTVLSVELGNSFFPSSQIELDLLQLLTLDVLYKRTFKSASDDAHPIIYELLNDLKLDSELISKCIERAQKHNPEVIYFYLLFQEELDHGNLSMNDLLETINKLAEDSKYGTIVSHPAKMTNPACKFPKILVHSKKLSDGFIRTGNVEVDFDMHINAVNLKVYKFVSLRYNQKTLLEYIRNYNFEIFVELFGVSEEQARTWVEKFRLCMATEDIRTNQYLKQVYFPIGNKYHSLSVLTPSGLVFSMKERIDFINDKSPDAYLGKKRLKKDAWANEFASIPNLTVTRHGGEHPKNISGLNNKYQSYYLLHSVPPVLQKHTIRFPNHNFLGESFRYYECRDIFAALHKLFKTGYNNKRIREGRDYRLQDLMERIIDKMWMVRGVAAEQYRSDDSRLRPHQKIWLCEEYMQNREQDAPWLDKLCKEITAWIIRTYEKLIGKQAIRLGEAERLHIYEIVSMNKEALR